MTVALLLACCWILAYFRARLWVWTAVMAALLLLWSIAATPLNACVVSVWGLFLALAGLIRQISEMGISVVLVEHDMELVMDICDRILVLNLGRMLAEGTPREIQENPAVVAAYLGEG